MSRQLLTTSSLQTLSTVLLQLFLDGHYRVSTCCSCKALPSKQRRESNRVAFLSSSIFQVCFPGPSGIYDPVLRLLTWQLHNDQGDEHSEEIHVLTIHKLVCAGNPVQTLRSATRQSEKSRLLEFNHPVPPSAISMWGQLMIWIDGTTQSVKTPGYMTGFQMQSGLVVIKNIHV